MGLTIDLTTYEKRVSLGGGSFGRDYETVGYTDSSFVQLAGDDTLYGPQDGADLEARLLGGNDTAALYSGFHRVNTNAGNDTIFIEGGSGFLLGGSENDTIQIAGGEFSSINGNKGNDTITNFNGFFSNIRGGSDNDVLINSGGGMGLFYGDSGADTFIPYAVNQYGAVLETFMLIKDYEPGIDTIDLSNVGGADIRYSGSDTLIGSFATGQLIAKVEGVLL